MVDTIRDKESRKRRAEEIRKLILMIRQNPEAMKKVKRLIAQTP